jgi:hypothetical protein
VKIHFSGWADVYDVKLKMSKFKSNAATHQTKIDKLPFEVGSAIEVYNDIIRRWRLGRIVDIDDSSKAIKVDSKFSSWIHLNRETCCCTNTHIYAPNSLSQQIRSSIVEAKSPYGTTHALEIAAKVRDTDIPACVVIYEELAMQHALSREQCLDLYQCLEDIAVAYVVEAKKNQSSATLIQERRHLDARASLAIEQAFLAGTSADSLPLAFRAATKAGAADCTNVVSALDNITDRQPDTNDYIIAPNSSVGLTMPHIECLLSHNETFRDLLLDQWSMIPTNAQRYLEAVDMLELDASRSLTCASRRTLYAEAARMMERMFFQEGLDLVGSREVTRDVRAVCCWKLARQYILGLGIDTIEHADRISSNMQASEYLGYSNLGGCAILEYYRGLCICLGRYHNPTRHNKHPFR